MVTKPFTESSVSQVGSTWGVRLNHDWHKSFQSPSSSKEPPLWLRGFYREDWQNKRGVVVWDDSTQKVEVLPVGEALELLANLRQNEKWQIEGIAITQRFKRRKSIEQPERKRSRKKRIQDEPFEPAPESKPVYEDVEEERIRLSSKAGVEFFTFLQEHETLLTQMAEKDEKHKEAVMRELWAMGFRMARKNEVAQIDFSARPLSWIHNAELHTWVCDLSPNRGTVKLGQNGWYWEISIEQPDQFERSGPIFVKMEEALAWTEQELLTLQKAASEETESVKVIPPPKPRMDLTAFQIDAATLEPERITYRVVMELEHIPDDFKTMEMSFGKIVRYAEEFPSPRRVSRELQIDSAQATVEWPAGIHSRWYLINSTATYFQENVAAAQAQQLWDQSGIQRLYKEGKIKQARYGYEEVETYYCTWLGGLDDPEKPWGKPETRAEHMASRAMDETIIHALDVDRFRENL